MGRAGILTEADRVELIEGDIVQMSPIGSRHAACVKRLVKLLHAACGDRAIVQVQDPVQMGDDSEPEPDVALLAPREDFYAAAHPTAGDAALLIEVADTTLEFDSDDKLRLYARSGVTEYWIVDLDGGRVLVHRSPSGDRYTDAYSVAAGGSVAPAALPEVTVDVAWILGRSQ